jgi:hypothetical protein
MIRSKVGRTGGILNPSARYNGSSANTSTAALVRTYFVFIFALVERENEKR